MKISLHNSPYDFFIIVCSPGGATSFLSTGQTHDIRDLLLRVAEGDESAFRQFYLQYYARLKPLVQKHTGSGTDAEEILQLAFLKVWLNREKLPEIENLQGWLYRIAYREYLNLVRSRLNYETKLSKYSASMSKTEKQELPLDNAHLENIRKSIRTVVENLAPQRKRIYELSRNEGLKVAEIAKILAISERTVKNVLFTVLKTIREHLIAEGYGPLSLVIFFTIFS